MGENTDNTMPIDEYYIISKLSPDQATEYIGLALEKYLPNYDFNHVISITQSELEKHVVPAKINTFVMELARNNKSL